jgi:hypothetical protein
MGLVVFDKVFPIDRKYNKPRLFTQHAGTTPPENEKVGKKQSWLSRLKQKWLKR